MNQTKIIKIFIIDFCGESYDILKMFSKNMPNVSFESIVDLTTFQIKQNSFADAYIIDFNFDLNNCNNVITSIRNLCGYDTKIALICKDKNDLHKLGKNYDIDFVIVKPIDKLQIFNFILTINTKTKTTLPGKIKINEILDDGQSIVQQFYSLEYFAKNISKAPFPHMLEVFLSKLEFVGQKVNFENFSMTSKLIRDMVAQIEDELCEKRSIKKNC
jgi:hypothetical protein